MELTPKRAGILLAFVISARATSFMFSKLCLTTMDPFSLLAVRFTVASLLLFLVFHRQIIRQFNKRDMLKGMLFGSLYFLTMNCELNGLKTTDSGVASFIENMAIILVPLAEAGLRRRPPEKRHLLRAVIALIGVAFLTMNGQQLQLSRGELFLLGSALFYSGAIITANRLTGSGNTFLMGFFQVCTIGAWGIIASVIRGSVIIPSTGTQWGMILMLAIVCTGFGFTLQPVAQSKLSSETAALFCALSPMIAGLLGILFMHETFTAFTLAGEALILLSLILH